MRTFTIEGYDRDGNCVMTNGRLDERRLKNSVEFNIEAMRDPTYRQIEIRIKAETYREPMPLVIADRVEVIGHNEWKGKRGRIRNFFHGKPSQCLVQFDGDNQFYEVPIRDLKKESAG